MFLKSFAVFLQVCKRTSHKLTDFSVCHGQVKSLVESALEKLVDNYVVKLPVQLTNNSPSVFAQINQHVSVACLFIYIDYFDTSFSPQIVSKRCLYPLQSFYVNLGEVIYGVITIQSCKQTTLYFRLRLKQNYSGNHNHCSYIGNFNFFAQLDWD